MLFAQLLKVVLHCPFFVLSTPCQLFDPIKTKVPRSCLLANGENNILFIVLSPAMDDNAQVAHASTTCPYRDIWFFTHWEFHHIVFFQLFHHPPWPSLKNWFSGDFQFVLFRSIKLHLEGSRGKWWFFAEKLKVCSWWFFSR